MPRTTRRYRRLRARHAFSPSTNPKEIGDDMEFKREYLSLGGGEEVPVMIGSSAGEPSSVFMSYEAYLEVATTLLLALNALRKGGMLTEDERVELAPTADGNVVDLALVREARASLG